MRGGAKRALRNLRIPELLERAVGIEPTFEAWKAPVLPLYDARSRYPPQLYRLAIHRSVKRRAISIITEWAERREAASGLNILRTHLHITGMHVELQPPLERVNPGLFISLRFQRKWMYEC